VENYLEKTDKRFDIIISIAALHHMDEEKVLSLMKNKLTENGKILILDLFQNRTMIDYIQTVIATILNPLIMLIKTGKLRESKNEWDAWAEHSQYGKYLTIIEIKNIAKRILEYAKIKRHLFWRYSLIYNNGK
jgi:2-polyprenyl-3-methyl-5-hydroxy-6-metoxy-1,4-benzoquinol methylase